MFYIQMCSHQIIGSTTHMKSYTVWGLKWQSNGSKWNILIAIITKGYSKDKCQQKESEENASTDCLFLNMSISILEEQTNTLKCF